MLEKEEYRLFFNKWKRYVRYAPILDDLGIPKPNFSQFLSGSNSNALSLEKLEQIRQRMNDVFAELPEPNKN